jgi:quercetin dioxygenase-like cupin family protein
MRTTVFLSVLLLVTASILQAENNGKAEFSAAATSKFAPMPGLPACASLSVQRGDPSKGAAVILLKAASGCVIPWHWHTVNESLVMVNGRAKIEMKDGAPVTFRPGDFIFLPGKHTHQFSCLAACMLYVMPDGAFDIHYVDASGKEISPDEAIKTPAAKDHSTKMKMSAPAAKTKEQ